MDWNLSKRALVKAMLREVKRTLFAPNCECAEVLNDRADAYREEGAKAERTHMLNVLWDQCGNPDVTALSAEAIALVSQLPTQTRDQRFATIAANAMRERDEQREERTRG